ncbi:low temperature requirement protein A [Plantactinospora sp. B24E8]|uniref:low temperature requirement protein A n=1 Tax=Plantactinospora sp. B24E8 TaxID=3153567 RepID=UPI00325F3B1D
MVRLSRGVWAGERDGRMVVDDDVPVAGSKRLRRTTYVELFFDLVYIFIFFRLARSLADDLTWLGAYQALILLLAVWWVWAYTNLLTDTMDSQRLPLQFLVMASTFAALLLSTAIPEAFEDRAHMFAVTYVAINLLRSGSGAIALRRQPLGRRPLRGFLWFAFSAVFWLAGMLVEEEARLVLWGVAILVDYVAAFAGWPVPGLGRARSVEWNLAGRHIAERYRQFTIIALGETIAATGRTFHESDLSPVRGVAFTVAFVTSVLLYWIYFHRTRERLGPPFSGRPSGETRPAGFAHLVMVAGVVMITVANELMIKDPTRPAPAAWVTVIVGGPALFLVGHAILGRRAFARVTQPRLIGAGLLVAAGPALVSLPALAVTGVVVVVLLAVVTVELAMPPN